MKSGRLILWSIAILLLFFIISCEKDRQAITADDPEATNNADVNVADTADYESGISEALLNNCENHEDNNDYTWDTADVVNITLNGTSITVDGTGAFASGSQLVITTAGSYSISGTLEDGQVIVNSPDDGEVKLIFNGADINCSDNSPLYIADADKAIIILATASLNYLSDGSTYAYDSTYDDQPNAAIFSMADLSVYGDGELTIDGNFADGIVSKDGLVICNTNLTVNSADDGIRGKDYLVIHDAAITVNAQGDGLKSDNEDDTGKGYIYIESGSIHVNSGGDGITCQTDVLIAGGDIAVTSGGGCNAAIAETESAKGLKAGVNIITEGGIISISSADDAVHTNGNIVLNGGILNLSTADDGIHAEAEITMNGDEVYIVKSYEGIEGPSITVNGGIVSIVTSDDGFNASKGNGGENNDGSNLVINGGTIYVNDAQGDGLDSNGSISISGGTITVHGPQSQPEVGMDYNGTCYVTGGFLVISGSNSNMTQGPSTISTQYSLKLIFTTNNTAGTLFHIEDNSGNGIVTYQPEHNYSSIVFSSPELKNGSTYNVYTGGSATGTMANGLYTDGEYIPGTKYTSFTISGILTSIGTGQGGGGGGPGGLGM